MSIINSILVGFIGLVASLFQALFRPLWNLAGQNFPDFVNLQSYILGLIQFVIGGIGWVINALGLEPIIHMICLYWISYVLIGIGAWGVKIALRWYRIIMP